MSPVAKAWLATAIFALVGLYSFLFFAPPSDILYAHAIFFAVLLVNTFFSVRFYSAIQPNDGPNALVDTVIVILYFALALSLGRPFGFAVTAVFFWIIACAKYALMINKIPYAALLRKKILIDSLGTFSAAALMTVSLAGYASFGAWTLAIVFALANIYVLWINPMYRL